ncbi:unnamed protein product [Acanthoscelides obtectus]|uniref:Putative nuclease HARBI1 n=1 Tax=Acanthoscelides obtectus TaxID=200917 RepID=A0A9P0NVS0_ACAOB|nr:unnamed protein product [Acanthoscelides obtectus]CAK1678591.1 Putative nuclease HARBI1 [Acanthoscelides obtectus]
MSTSVTLDINKELSVSQGTVSRTVDRAVNSIVAQWNEWIKFPTTNHELMEVKRIWQSTYKFPTTIGVIDCTHIGILKANHHGDEYINRKGKPTLNVQATCDSREMFTSVDVSWPGSVHDSRIWRNSQTRSQLINKANVALLGDDGYDMILPRTEAKWQQWYEEVESDVVSELDINDAASEHSLHDTNTEQSSDSDDEDICLPLSHLL